MPGEITRFNCPDIPETKHPELVLGFSIMRVNDPEVLKNAIIERVSDQEGYEKIASAIQLAELAHEKQQRKEGKPYIIHPLRVTLRLMQYTQTVGGQLPNPNDLYISLLHDVLEDSTKVSQAKILEVFGDEVLGGVKALTKKYRHNKVKGKKPRKYFSDISRAPQNIQIIKVLDRIDNVDSLFYLKPSPKNPFFIHKQLAETRRYVVPIAQRFPVLCRDLQTLMVRVGASRRHLRKP